MGIDQEPGIGGPVGSAWREHVLTRVAEQRAMLAWLMAEQNQSDPQAVALAEAVRAHLQAAREAADRRPRSSPRASIGGATLERACSHLDAVECDLLRLANHRHRRGQLPSLLAHVRRHLETEDPRRVAVEQLALRAADAPWHDTDRERVVSALHAANSKARREVRQVRSFRNALVATAIALMIAAIAMAIVGYASPGSIPLCFNPDDLVVCPTSEMSVATPENPTPADHAKVDKALRGATSPGDVALIELLGMMAAALSAALALRNIQGTSSPYSLPIALAVLKLPTGALTAVLAILLMRGDFVPGLSALDSSAQILAWAIIFGYAQQLLTQLVDRQANTVLDNVRPGGTAPAGTAIASIGASGEPFTGGAGGADLGGGNGTAAAPAQPPAAARDQVIDAPDDDDSRRHPTRTKRAKIERSGARRTLAHGGQQRGCTPCTHHDSTAGWRSSPARPAAPAAARRSRWAKPARPSTAPGAPRARTARPTTTARRRSRRPPSS